MSKTLAVPVNKDAYERIQQLAHDEHLSIEDYVRNKVFGDAKFIVEEAIEIISKSEFDKMNTYPNGFSLPDLYGDKWSLPKERAMKFGRDFYEYVRDNPDLGIRCVSNIVGERAEYKYYLQHEVNEQL